LKTLFGGFWRRILGTARLAVLSQFEYRLNFFTDAILQPVISAATEVTLWWAIFRGSGLTEMGGFKSEYYLVYALWAAFFARISISWMYEYRMIDDIDSGRINAILTRPISFYEFYLGQFMGYKLLCAVFSLAVPFAACLLIESPADLWRFPLAFGLVIYYLILVHTMSYAVSALAFFYNRIHSIPAAKNIVLWVLSGELFPLDLVPDPWRGWLLKLPFACGAYVPVGYITRRIGSGLVWQGFISITIGIACFAAAGSVLWYYGRRVYSGTGA
jgi:ABC-2 type transport system permease protein